MTKVYLDFRKKPHSSENSFSQEIKYYGLTQVQVIGPLQIKMAVGISYIWLLTYCPEKIPFIDMAFKWVLNVSFIDVFNDVD